ncbi:MAG: hypothetical protein Q9165_001580 [Trypethelium subeluteriae]
MAARHGPTRRLIQELQDYQHEPNEALVELGPVSDDELMRWSAVMRGGKDTSYEGGLWKLDINIPDSYPHAPPEIKFRTPICHPNVNLKTGEICLDLFKSSWTPMYTIATTLNSVYMLLTTPEPDSPLNVDIAQLYRQGDLIGADALIRYYTETYRWDGR